MTAYYLFCYVAMSVATLSVYYIVESIEKAIKKRKIKKLKREYRREKQTAEYAEFVALSEAF